LYVFSIFIFLSLSNSASANEYTGWLVDNNGVGAGAEFEGDVT
jgi:hypothetical protein